jgi:acetoacetyl-CoA synthetase
MMSLVQEKISDLRSHPVVLLKPGTGVALFIVHGLGGNVWELADLGRLIPSPRPVYAIEAKGLDGTEAPIDCLEEMASNYAALIREVQPRGPYMLAGYSFGGVVAFEMAHQLVDAGQEVALLVLLDSYTHLFNWPAAVHRQVWRGRIAHGITLAARVPIRQTIGYCISRSKDVCRNLREHGRAIGPLGVQREHQRPPEVQRVFECCAAAWIAYRPRFYPGKITFLKAGRNVRFPKDPRAIWGNLARQVVIHTVPGEHVELVGPKVDGLAQRLSLCMDEALGPSDRK